MPDTKRAIQLVSSEGDEAGVKPEPPPDLWQRIEEALSETRLASKKLPDGAFTINQYSRARRISYNTASDRIRELERAGAIRRLQGTLGSGGANLYVLVEK